MELAIRRDEDSGWTKCVFPLPENGVDRLFEAVRKGLPGVKHLMIEDGEEGCWVWASGSLAGRWVNFAANAELNEMFVTIALESVDPLDFTRDVEPQDKQWLDLVGPARVLLSVFN